MASQFTRAHVRALLIAALFLPFLVATPSAQSADGAALDAHPLSLTSATAPGPGAYESDVVLATFTMFGLTWQGQGPAEAWYRVGDADLAWSSWRSFEAEGVDGPDPGTEGPENPRGGTDPVYVGVNERIQFRFSSDAPRAIEAVLLDTSALEGAGGQSYIEQLAPEANGSVPAQPAIRPRSDWDPTNQCPPRETPEEIQVTTAIVHHTGIHNSYSSSAVPGILLGYCLYHRNSQGWDDLAYNLLIDRFGTIWEGRAGGVDKAIRGGHAKGFSSYSSGIAMIGNFTGAAPSWQQRQALERLLAWKLGIHNLDPLGTTDVISMGSYKWDEGVPVTLPTISGHSDVQATACPGSYAYNLFSTFRANTAAVWRPPSTDHYAHPVAGDFDGDGTEEGAVYRKSDGTWWVYDNGASVVALDGSDGEVVAGAIAADIDGDGADEIVVRVGATVRVLQVSGSTATSSTIGSLGSSSGWSASVGDVDGNGADDVVFVNGSGSASVATSATVASWGSIGAGHVTTTVGDFDGDGASDLAGLRSNGSVDVARSTGSTFGSPAVWGDAGPEGGWQYAIAGDLDGDGDDDVAAFRSSSDTWHGLRSTGSQFGAMETVSTPTLDHWSEAFAYDYGDDGRVEVIALNAYTGTWHLGRFDGLTPVFTRLEDAPYRNTVVRNESGAGVSYLSWFGQEFAWVKTDLGYGVGGEADATSRVFGSSRYDTAAQVSRLAFSRSDVVFVGTGEKYPDALTGGSAAVLHDAPVLLTGSTSLPSSTRSEIQRLRPSQIVLLGGPAAVSAGVEAQLAALAPSGVVRIGGADRYETAALISRAYFAPGVTTVYVATGTNFPDALAGVPGADRANAPMLLVRSDSVPAATAIEIGRLAPDEIVILGGPAAVDERVARTLSSYAPTVRRLSGSDRYGTAAAISAEAFPSGTEVVFVATGTNFPDAIVAGPAAAHLGGSLLLVREDAATNPTVGELRRLRPSRITVIGSESIISDEALEDLEGIGIGGLTSRVSELPRP